MEEVCLERKRLQVFEADEEMQVFGSR